VALISGTALSLPCRSTNLEHVKTFGKMGVGPGELGAVYGMAAHDGNLFVADCSNSCIHRFSKGGDFLGCVGSVRNPRGIVVMERCAAHRGLLLVAERARVQVLARSGELLQLLYVPAASSLWGITFDSTSWMVYVADQDKAMLHGFRLTHQESGSDSESWLYSTATVSSGINSRSTIHAMMEASGTGGATNDPTLTRSQSKLTYI